MALTPTVCVVKYTSYYKVKIQNDLDVLKIKLWCSNINQAPLAKVLAQSPDVITHSLLCK